MIKLFDEGKNLILIIFGICSSSDSEMFKLNVNMASEIM